MYYTDIYKTDTTNGVGVRVVLWTSGCSHHCKDCHNPQTWSPTNGYPFTSETVEEIQGAEFFKNVILAATNDETQAIFKINPADGSVEKLLDRNLTKFSEGEGMTVMIKDGKPVILAMDMGPLFVNAFVREYDISAADGNE